MGIFSSREHRYELMPRPRGKTSAIIVAAGDSTRMKSVNKQFLELGGMPVLARAIQAFEFTDIISEIVVCVKQEDIRRTRELIEKYRFKKVKDIALGGSTRQASVLNALKCVSDGIKWVAIHDGARPFVTADEIIRCALACETYGAAALAVPVKDTIKIVDDHGFISATPERDTLRAVQTPQFFQLEDYQKAVEQLGDAVFDYTDDCKLMEQIDRPVFLVDGSYENIKITTPEDIPAAQAILESRGED